VHQTALKGFREKMFEKSGPDSLEGQLMWGLRAQIKELREALEKIAEKASPIYYPENAHLGAIHELATKALDKQKKAW
jgi:uncharacterized membrane protein